MVTSVPHGLSQSGVAAIRTVVAGQPIVGQPVAGDSQMKAGIALQRPGQHQAQNVGTAGLNMLATVGARQQQRSQQQQTSQPAPVKVIIL